MYDLKTGHAKHAGMRNAILAAALLHAALLIGLSFERPEARHYNRQIEITLTTRPSAKAPERASHIAQADQAGSGERAEREVATSRDPAPQTGERLQGQLPLQRPRTEAQLHRELVTTTGEAEQLQSREQQAREEQRRRLQGLSPVVEALNRELATLEAELDQQTRNYAAMPRVRRLTSVSARRAVDAAYLHDWRARVEAVGNRYYPEASVRYGLYGKLRLLVVIRQDGSLEDIRVLSSSGYAVLDEAAIKIVQMAAPYAPFPAELRATTDKLEIIRTWQFDENRLSSG
jgi:protein TonB